MLSWVAGPPHSGHSTASAEWARASAMSRDRSSWMRWSPRQGQPRCASAQRPCIVATGCLLGSWLFLLTLLRCASPGAEFARTPPVRGERLGDASDGHPFDMTELPPVLIA